MALARLPLELLDVILGYTDDLGTLLNLRSVCRALLSAVNWSGKLDTCLVIDLDDCRPNGQGIQCKLELIFLPEPPDPAVRLTHDDLARHNLFVSRPNTIVQSSDLVRHETNGLGFWLAGLWKIEIHDLVQCSVDLSNFPQAERELTMLERVIDLSFDLIQGIPLRRGSVIFSPPTLSTEWNRFERIINKINHSNAGFEASVTVDSGRNGICLDNVVSIGSKVKSVKFVVPAGDNSPFNDFVLSQDLRELTVTSRITSDGFYVLLRDEFRRTISNCTGLKRLSLRSVQMEEEQWIEALPSDIATLEVEGSIFPTRTCPSITCDVQHLNISEGSSKHFTNVQFPHLERLELNRTLLLNGLDSFITPTNLRNLRRLHVEANQLQSLELLSREEFSRSQIRELQITTFFTTLTPQILDNLLELQHIESLTIRSRHTKEASDIVKTKRRETMELFVRNAVATYHHLKMLRIFIEGDPDVFLFEQSLDEYKQKRKEAIRNPYVNFLKQFSSITIE
jgi:hypothetical protein